MWIACCDLGKANEVEQFACSRFTLCSISNAETNILNNAQVREQGVFLEHHADSALLGRQLTVATADEFSTDMDGAVDRRLKTRDAAQQRGFAAAAGTEQATDLTIRKIQGELLENRLIAIGDLDIPDVQCRTHADTRAALLRRIPRLSRTIGRMPAATIISAGGPASARRSSPAIS